MNTIELKMSLILEDYRRQGLNAPAKPLAAEEATRRIEKELSTLDMFQKQDDSAQDRWLGKGVVSLYNSGGGMLPPSYYAAQYSDDGMTRHQKICLFGEDDVLAQTTTETRIGERTIDMLELSATLQQMTVRAYRLNRENPAASTFQELKVADL